MPVRALLVALAMGVVQHILHECSHIAVARLQGVSVLRVHWFTYSRLGTRVFYRDEPDMGQAQVERKWGWIALGGALGTMLAGYLLTAAYLLGAGHQSVWSVLLLFYGPLLFLTTDPIYFVLGALFNFGDAVGVMKAFRVGRPAVVATAAFCLALAVWVITRVWY